MGLSRDIDDPNKTKTTLARLFIVHAIKMIRVKRSYPSRSQIHSRWETLKWQCLAVFSVQDMWEGWF